LVRKLAIAAAVLVTAVGGALVYAYHEVVTLEPERVTEDIHLVQAGGINGNVAVLRTADGAVIVDTMTFRAQGVRLRELAERLAGGPVQAVINTHYHMDHTHGNPGFPAGTRVVATRRTREYLLARDGDYWSDGNEGTLPNDTVDGEHELRIGGKTIRALHLGRGHTGGDLVVLFVEDRVLHLGDLFVNARYPNVDLEAGGSIEAWIATLDRALALDFDRVIPGHGPVADREAIRAFQSFLREVWQLAVEAAREGLSLQGTQELARRSLTGDRGFGVVKIPFLVTLDRDFVVGRAYEEATRREGSGGASPGS
jgi:glyoxylase-like metal-dependent hydrolase (beta-lactamase superfamily II)